MVEPREQVVDIALSGDRWPAEDHGYMNLDPARDRQTFLRLDLGAVVPERGAASMQANTWVLDDALTLRDGLETQP